MGKTYRNRPAFGQRQQPARVIAILLMSGETVHRTVPEHKLQGVIRNQRQRSDVFAVKVEA